MVFLKLNGWKNKLQYKNKSSETGHNIVNNTSSCLRMFYKSC